MAQCKIQIATSPTQNNHVSSWTTNSETARETETGAGAGTALQGKAGNTQSSEELLTYLLSIWLVEVLTASLRIPFSCFRWLISASICSRSCWNWRGKRTIQKKIKLRSDTKRKHTQKATHTPPKSSRYNISLNKWNLSWFFWRGAALPPSSHTQS